MKIGIPVEVLKDENRVAITPEHLGKILALGFSVSVESGAGEKAGFTDASYITAGAVIQSETKALWGECDIIMKVRPPAYNDSLKIHETDLMKEGACLISFIQPSVNEELIDKLQQKKITALAMDLVPRISRAQKLDSLSSMAGIAGYRAVIEAAELFGRFFAGQITAAGKTDPAKVLIIGAGVAGLSAIGTAKSLGALVFGFDTRPEVKDQIESLGATFLSMDVEEDGAGEGGYAKVMSDAFIKAEMALLAEHAREVDIIITTAMIPGKKAPVLITAPMVESMKPGSVIIDLASEQGGNCELTEPGTTVKKHAVSIVGHTNMVSRLPNHASQLYGSNLSHLLTELTPQKNGNIVFNMEDEVVREMTVVSQGELMWPPPEKPPVQTADFSKAADSRNENPQTDDIDTIRKTPSEKKQIKGGKTILITSGLFLFILTGSQAPPEFLKHMTVFTLACFTGYMVVWNVTPSLHTPLMSVTNAISGIIVIGALLQISGPVFSTGTLLACLAVLIATINVSGGFLVTRRMLKMFKKGNRHE